LLFPFCSFIDDKLNSYLSVIGLSVSYKIT
jgi:hypothetical protein